MRHCRIAPHEEAKASIRLSAVVQAGAHPIVATTPLAPFKQTGETRIFPVDVLRGLAISSVVYLHLELFKFRMPVLLGPYLSWHLQTNGYYGVSIFFVISGFLITRYIIARDGQLGAVHLADFYVRRISRIVPGFALIIAVNVILFALAVPGFRWNTATAPLGPLIFDVLTLRANIYRIHYGTVSLPWDILWSLAVEEVFYVFYPLICRTLRKQSFIVTFLALTVIVGPVYRHVAGDGAGLYGYFACFDLLAIGCLVAIAEWRLRGNSRARASARALQWIGACGLLLVYLNVPVLEFRTFGPTLAGLCAAFFIAGSAFLTDGSVPLAKPPVVSRFFSHLGSLSYEVYLFHLVVLTLIAGIYHALAAATGAAWLFDATDIAFMLLIVLFAALATQLARQLLDPARRRLRRLLLRPSPKPPN